MDNVTLRDILSWLDKPRSGWVIRDIPGEIQETVLLHIEKIVQAAKLYAEIFPHLDSKKLVKMAMYHDIAEYKEKDYLPGEISLEEKHRREKAVVESLRDTFGRWQEIHAIWSEYEERKTPEAITTKQLDIMDTGLQALHYFQLGHYDKIRDFFPWAEEKLSDPLLRKIWDILCYGEFEADIFEQYFLLLKLRGDEKLFREEMSRRTKGN